MNADRGCAPYLPSDYNTLCLNAIDGLGVRRYWQLIRAFLNVNKIVSADHAKLASVVGDPLAREIRHTFDS